MKAACLAAALVALPVLSQQAPAPHPGLSIGEGAWEGTLTYRDDSRPDRMVSLPATAFVALAAPSELVVHYIFKDGPGKIVHSHERMAFDFTQGELAWSSGSPARSNTYKIVSAEPAGAGYRIRFERAVEGRTDRYRFDLAAPLFFMVKEEVAADGTSTLRNKYELKRQGR